MNPDTGSQLKIFGSAKLTCPWSSAHEIVRRLAARVSQ